MRKTFYKIVLALPLALLIKGSFTMWAAQASASPLHATMVTISEQQTPGMHYLSPMHLYNLQSTCPPPPYGCW